GAGVLGLPPKEKRRRQRGRRRERAGVDSIETADVSEQADLSDQRMEMDIECKQSLCKDIDGGKFQLNEATITAETAARSAAVSEVKQLQQQVVALHANLGNNVATASEYNGLIAGLEAELEAVRAVLTSATMGSEHLAQQVVELESKQSEAEHEKKSLRVALADAERELDEMKIDGAEACQQALDLAEK
ncbi:unnamed protein product, partial [Prorocentrum cordatum]